MSKFSVAVVGGGVTGVSALHRLVKKMAQEPELLQRCEGVHVWDEGCVEEQESKGTEEMSTSGYAGAGGRAWSGGNSDVQLFNFPAGVASLELHDYSGAFLHWCASSGVEGVAFGSYPPRYLFGRYCAHFLKGTLALAEDKGIEVKIHSKSRVTDVQRVHESQPQMRVTYTELVSGATQAVVVDAAILCTGPAAIENDVLAHLRGKVGYFRSPWPHPRIAPAASVAIVGTGLSAVDTVKQLMASGHTGPVVMASRRGLLPTIKATVFDPFVPLSVATPEAVQALVAEHGAGSNGLLSKFMDLIRQEIIAFQDSAPESAAVCLKDFDKCFQAALSSDERDGEAELRNNLRASKKGKRLPWQDCLIALGIRDVVRGMWDHLGLEERHFYQERYSTLLNIHFNSMPVSSGDDMLQFLERGSCTLTGGLCEIVAVERGGFELKFRNSKPSVHVEHVINAMGFGKSFTKSAPLSDFHRNILEKNDLVQPCEFGGLACDFSTGRLKGHESAEEAGHALLYAAGHLISGTKLLTSGVSYCLADGAAAVDDLIGQLKKEHSS